VGVSVTDIAAGMTAFQAILQALIGRGRIGRGRGIEVSLFHATADWMNVPYLQHRYGGHTPARCGLAHPTIAPYGAFTCGDGKAVLFSIQNEREWLSLCAHVLGSAALAQDPKFKTNPDRVANRAELEALIELAFAAHDRETVSRMLEQAGIAYGRLSSLDDLEAHPQRRMMPVATPAGPIELLAPGALVDGVPLEPGPVPALDEQGSAIWAEFAADG
jgi:crotonobetainyl-CoA:carnitine CoA-transferase CaiB-like acyl-CoA transferase